jgi:hypothetical protein
MDKQNLSQISGKKITPFKIVPKEESSSKLTKRRVLIQEKRDASNKHDKSITSSQ